MKIISFSLWGDNPKYLVGAVENCLLAKDIYPNWQCRFYVDSRVNEKTKQDLISNGGRVIEITNNLGPFYGGFWRFFANDDPEMEVMISRDCDSRLSYREKAAVDEWINSDKCFHTMHDHRCHPYEPILAGMWGAKKGCIMNLSGRIAGWRRFDRWGVDQDFLRNVIWNEVCGKTMAHSSVNMRWKQHVPFPPYPSNGKYNVKYVGEVYDENHKAVFIP